MSDNKFNGRREFLKSSAALGLTAGAIPVVKAQGSDALARSAYGERSRFVNSQRISDGGGNCSFGSDCNTLTPLQDPTTILTATMLIVAHGK